jgi:hypothetical protein
MKKILGYIYFREYCWSLYLWKNKSLAAFNTSMAIASSFFGILIFLKSIILSNRSSYHIIGFYISSGLTIGFFFIIYYLFEHNKKYLELEEKYTHIKKNRKKWYIEGILVFFFTVMPVIFLIFQDYFR